MKAGRTRSVAVGVVFWIALVGVIGWQLVRADARWLGQVGRYTARRPEQAMIQLPVSNLRLDTPVFLRDAEDRWMLAGHVTAVRRAGAAGTTARVAWRGDRRLAEHRLTLHHSRTDLAGVVETMLPPEKRERIEQRLAAAVREHGDEIVAALRPVIEQAVQESLPVIEDGLQEALRGHRTELQALADRYREEIVQQRLLPLMRDEVLPVVREHGEPIAREIGRELWNRASVWRFGWRALYDRSPLPDRELTRREWNRFVTEEAIPVLEAHLDELVAAQRKILVDLSRDPDIRRELRAIADDLIEDPELQELVGTILREAILENAELREVWARAWQSDEAQRAWRLTGDRLEPVVREIGDELFGTRREGITPEFARVLRSQILGKDQQWILAAPGGDPARADEPIPVRLATTEQPFPLVLAGRDEW